MRRLVEPRRGCAGDAAVTRDAPSLSNVRCTRSTDLLEHWGADTACPIRRNVEHVPYRDLAPCPARLAREVYRAFLEGDALAKWLPPYSFIATVHHMDPQVGGTFRMSFRNFGTGKSESFGGTYLELVPHQRIRYGSIRRSEHAGRHGHDDHVDAGHLRDGILRVEQAGIPEAIPLEFCYLGWQESLVQLAALVEPNIPG